MKYRFGALILLLMVGFWSACDDDIDVPDGAGGATASSTASATATSSPASTGAGGIPVCDGPPDGFCDTLANEGCPCADCADTGLCVPGNCVTDDFGFCDPELDSCTCEDCDHDYQCGDPGDLNCDFNGTCDPYIEGCNCEECWTYPDCVDNVMACDGAPDNMCDLANETCACVDCLGQLGCDPCTVDGSCEYEESCHCADCLMDPFCLDTANCENDTICAPLYEGCGCQDCNNAPACTGGGGAGGTGGAGGAGGGGGN